MALAFAAPFLILLLASPSVFATDYTVGDTSGWNLGVNYGNWASGKTFKVGDTLLFNYDSSHQLDEVDENAYKSCGTSNPIKNHQDGKTKITLSKAGSMYFLCPTVGHCSGGMKLQVNVAAASGTPTTPTTPSGSPTTPSGSPTTPRGSPSTPSPPSPAGSTSAPSPRANGAASVSSGISQLLGSLFASAIILGLMF